MTDDPDKPQAPPASTSDQATEGEANADPRVLALLVCPLTKTTLEYRRETGELLSRAAGLAYPIRNGVPMMTEDAARPLTDDEIESLRR